MKYVRKHLKKEEMRANAIKHDALDRNDEDVTDFIGRQKFIDSLYGDITGLGKDENRRLCIYGEWGSGKTYVLKLLEKKLLEGSDDAETYIIVYYDAWKNSFYEDPLIALVYCVTDTIKQLNPKAYMAAKKRTHKVMDWEKLRAVVGNLTDINDEVLFLSKIVESLFSIVDLVGRFRGNGLPENKKLSEYESYSNLLDCFLKILNAITLSRDGAKTSRKSKLVIMIDEIDRCLLEMQLKILECTHNLFSVKNCIIIYSLNLNETVKYYNHWYGTGNGRLFFEKIAGTMYELSPSTDIYFTRRLTESIMRKYERKTSADTTLTFFEGKNFELKKKYLWRIVSAEISKNILNFGIEREKKNTYKSIEQLREFTNRQVTSFLFVMEKLMEKVFGGETRGTPNSLYENELTYVYAYLLCCLSILKLFNETLFEELKAGTSKVYTDYIDRIDVAALYAHYDETNYWPILHKESDDSIEKFVKLYVKKTCGADKEIIDYKLPDDIKPYADSDFNIINYVLNIRSDVVKKSSVAECYEIQIGRDTRRLSNALEIMINEIDRETEFLAF